MSPIRARKKVRIGPRWLNINWNFTQKGYSSRGYQVGPWSWNTNARRHRVGLPGPLHWIGQRKPRSGPRTPSRPPRDLRPAANWAGALAGGLVVFGLLIGGGTLALIGAVASGFTAVGLTVRHIRNERAQGRQGLPFLPAPSEIGSWRASDDIGHSPKCRAKSAATCRCPGRRNRRRT